MKKSTQRMLKTQLLRRRRVVVVDRRDRQEDDHVDRDVEEDLVQNVDVEVVVDEVREVDLPAVVEDDVEEEDEVGEVDVHVGGCCQMLSSRRWDLVEEDDVEEVVERWLMSRCGWGGSSLLTWAEWRRG